MPPSGLELVAEAPHGDDVARVRRVVLDLGAQPTDVHVDETAVAEVVVAPDPLEQHLAAEHPAGAGGQLDQPSASQIVPGPVLSISIHPTLEWTTPTRAAAVELWGARLPADLPEKLAKILFGYSNLPGTQEICGAQAALGITFSGLTRADYAGEYWPEHITNIRDERVLKFIEDTLYLLPLPPAGPPQPENSQIYADSLGLLATASEACWQALLNTNLNAFGQGLRQSFEAQLAISPRLLTRERLRIVEAFREQALGWQVSGGHLLLVSAQPVKNALRLSIRRESD